MSWTGISAFCPRSEPQVLPLDEDNRSHPVEPLLPVGLYIGVLDRYTERTMQSTAETVAEYLERDCKVVLGYGERRIAGT